MLSYADEPPFQAPGIRDIVDSIFDIDWGYVALATACIVLAVGLYIVIICYVWTPFARKHSIRMSSHDGVTTISWRARPKPVQPLAKPVPSKPPDSTWDGFVVELDQDPDDWLRGMTHDAQVIRELEERFKL